MTKKNNFDKIKATAAGIAICAAILGVQTEFIEGQQHVVQIINNLDSTTKLATQNMIDLHDHDIRIAKLETINSIKFSEKH